MPAFIDTMMYVGEQPWHKQGTRLHKPPTIQEALELSGLNWKVQKRPTYYNLNPDIYGYDSLDNESEDGFGNVSTGHFVTVRTDTNEVLGHVSAKYGVLQNSEAFQPFEPLIDMGFQLETAGATQQGRRVWILAKSPDAYMVGDDEIEKYVLLYTSHDGSTGSVFRPTGVRVVCQNTIELALSRQSKWNYTLKHTASIKERVNNLTNILEKCNGDFRTAINDMERFQDTDMTPAMLDMYLETVIPFLKDRDKESIPEMKIFVRNTAKPVYEKIVDNFYNGRGNKGRTLWDAYNAITEYYTHDKQYKDWVQTTQFGAGYDYKVKAFRIASKIAKASANSLQVTMN